MVKIISWGVLLRGVQSDTSKIKSNRFSALIDQSLSSFPLLLADLDMKVKLIKNNSVSYTESVHF